MRGQADWDGPAKENPEYTPATNALAYLDNLAKRTRQSSYALRLQLGTSAARGSSLMPFRRWVEKRRCASS